MTFIGSSSFSTVFFWAPGTTVNGPIGQSLTNLSGNDAYDELFPNAMMGGAMMTTHSDDSDEEDDKMLGFFLVFYIDTFVEFWWIKKSGK